ncbi:hypothetical protein BP00DRAFT_445551 [Aspergillus indologenus CBS 114.80]|uniref:Uncharacterized protein n=1 Tax=Aspergillus indologenus CBS 114.80 TaxID=1450541 RepID=A0A2V5J4N8_9EURO|nr:hypothetical protein BP00DRAFT_445551 [Aspergillus indologenus CBS 114.80]
MDAQALVIGAAPAPAPAPMETWQTEFEGHTITVHTDAVFTDSRGSGPTDPVTWTRTTTVGAELDVSVNGNVVQGPTVLAFNLPADLADPWEFAARFLQHEWRAQRQNHTNSYPPEMLFGASRRVSSANARASSTRPRPPTTGPRCSGPFAFKTDLLFKQGGPGAGAVAVAGRGLIFVAWLLDMLASLTDRLSARDGR